MKGKKYKSKVGCQERVGEKRVKADRGGDRKEKEGWLKSEVPTREKEKEREGEELRKEREGWSHKEVQ